MKVIITGGGGFLGSQLWQKLLARGELTGSSGSPERIAQIVLLDAVFHQPATDPRVHQARGDIGDRATVLQAVGTESSTSIFHLASMVSGECEERFDDALRVNSRRRAQRLRSRPHDSRPPPCRVCQQHRLLRRRGHAGPQHRTAPSSRRAPPTA